MFARCTTTGTLKHALSLLLTPVIAYMYVLILLLTVDRRHHGRDRSTRTVDGPDNERRRRDATPTRPRAVTDEDESSESVKSAL